MKRVIFLSLVAVLLCMGCDISKTELFKSYINTYYYSENIQLRITDAGNIAIYREYLHPKKIILKLQFILLNRKEKKKKYTTSYVKFTTTLAITRKGVI